MPKKKITKKQQEIYNRGEPLVHPYHKKLYKVLKSIAQEVSGGWSISVPKPSYLAMICDQDFGSWFMQCLDALEKKGKLIKFWKDNEFVVEIFPF